LKYPENKSGQQARRQSYSVTCCTVISVTSFRNSGYCI